MSQPLHFDAAERLSPDSSMSSSGNTGTTMPNPAASMNSVMVINVNACFLENPASTWAELLCGELPPVELLLIDEFAPVPGTTLAFPVVYG